MNAEPLDDNRSKYVAWKLEIPGAGDFGVLYSYRRLGEDNGMNTMVYLENNLRIALRQFETVFRRQ